MNKIEDEKVREMKRIRRFVSFMLSIVLMIGLCEAFGAVKVQAKESKYHFEEKRATWISFIDLQNYLLDKDEEAFAETFEKMCDTAKKQKLNTLIVHVRAMGDAIYPSDIYDWAYYISSDKSDPGYDPLQIMLDIAHEKGLAFEAWINPYRVSGATDRTARTKKTAFYKKHKSKMIEYDFNGEHCLAFDPADESARKLIIKGVKELVTNYDVDGVHMDDYFYIGTMGPKLSVKQKRKNVNALVKGIYSTIKEIDPSCEFGISPAGNMENAIYDGADIERWGSTPGYVDYLMPQIYWTNKYLTSGGIIPLYSNRAKQWRDVVTCDEVKLYTGLALYRVGEVSSIDREWSQRKDNMANQYNIAMNLGYSGYALYRFEWMDMAISKTELRNLKNAVITRNNPGVVYSVNKKNTKWYTYLTNGTGQNTKDKTDAVLGYKVKLNKVKGKIEYKSYTQKGRWLSWKSKNSLSGKKKGNKGITAVKVRLSGEAKEKYKVAYKVFVKGKGWTSWTYDGRMAGSRNKKRPILAIKIKLVKRK